MDLWEGCHKTTLLNLACEYGQEKLVNVIISEQTELHIDCQDELGKTPLMVAAKKGLQSIVDTLIERCIYSYIIVQLNQQCDSESAFFK